MIPTQLSPDSKSKYETLELKNTLNGLKYFLVEELRTARRFISHVGIEGKIEDLEIVQLDKKTKRETVQSFLKKHGRHNVGVISEAGCPGIADPGSVAVEVAYQLGMSVEPLVGPSSILLTLMSSGFNGQKFTFHGYLPIDRSKRETQLKFLQKQIETTGYTQLFMETPFRNNQMLESILKIVSPKVKLCLGVNIHSADQYFMTKTIAEWKKVKIDLHKKPTIFCFGV